jgi:hypothetical protein
MTEYVEVVSTVSLVDDFLNFKTAKEELENEEEKKIFYFAQNLISKLTNNEIEFALNIIEKIKALNLTGKVQKGGTNEIITFEKKNNEVIVKSIKRNNFLYYVLNIFLILITYTIISHLFRNTLILQKDLIAEQFKRINKELKNEQEELNLMNNYILQLNQISTMKQIEPFIFEENEIEDLSFSNIFEDINEENNTFNLLSRFYTQIKQYTEFDPSIHLPDMGNLI